MNISIVSSHGTRTGNQRFVEFNESDVELVKNGGKHKFKHSEN